MFARWELKNLHDLRVIRQVGTFIFIYNMHNISISVQKGLDYLGHDLSEVRQIENKRLCEYIDRRNWVEGALADGLEYQVASISALCTCLPLHLSKRRWSSCCRHVLGNPKQ